MVNTEWQLKTISRQSQITGSPFEVGQRIISYIYKDDSGEIHRDDIHADDTNEYNPPGILLGWWEQVVKNYDNEAEARRQAINSSEELFLSLYEEEGIETREREVIKFLLALMLERKKILKPLIKTPADAVQKYLHNRTNREYKVPIIDLTAESVQEVMGQLKEVVVME